MAQLLLVIIYNSYNYAHATINYKHLLIRFVWSYLKQREEVFILIAQRVPFVD